MQDTKLITTFEAAGILGCTTEYVRVLSNAGRIPVAALVGRNQRLFDRAEVERFKADRDARRRERVIA